MPAQFDVFRTDDGALLVVLQSDLLDEMATRVVAPLVPATRIPRTFRRLMPEIPMGDGVFMLLPQNAATLTRSELGSRVGSVAHLRDEIVRAVDVLISGV